MGYFPISIGVEYVGAYTGTGSPGAPYGNLYSPRSCVHGLYDIVSDPNTNWTWGFEWGDSAAWELDWKAYGRLGGNDYRLTDDVDLNAYSGHGLGRCFVFNNQNNDWYTTMGDLDMGDRDAEWMLTFTCNFTNGTAAQVGPAADGVHLICGYKTDMTITTNAGARFAYYATHGSTVKTAWVNQGWDTQLPSDRNTICIFGATAAANDYLWGYGSVCSDPPFYTNSPSSYQFWTRDLWS